jgi:hypothetical protein
MLGPALLREICFARGDPPAHGNAGLLHALRPTRDQRMPPGEAAPLGEPPIGASHWQPWEFAHRFRRKFDAIPYVLLPVLIVATAAGMAIEQAAADVGVVNVAAILVLELDEATAPAAVAEAFPFGFAHLLERLGPPERRRRAIGQTRFPSVDAQWKRRGFACFLDTILVMPGLVPGIHVANDLVDIRTSTIRRSPRPLSF